MKFLKKSTSFLLFLAFLFGGFSAVSAEESSLSEEKENLNKVNLVLDNLVDDLNEQLANGEEEATAIGYFEGEPIEVSFELNDVLPDVSNGITPFAAKDLRTKSFKVYLKHTAGANFEHIVHGDWTYDSKTTTVKSVSPKSILAGPLYSKSDKTTSHKKTNSVHEVNSRGKFVFLKYTVEKQTYIDIWVNGTGTYQIKKLAIA